MMLNRSRTTSRLIHAALVLAVAGGGLGLSGCSSTKDAAMDAGEGMGEMAKEAGTGAARTALAPAVNPVLELLNKGKDEVEGGNLSAAVATMGGFEALWSKAAPVIQPLAGDKWPAIETAAKGVMDTFSGGATPDATAASSAISGLIGPLSGLMGK